MRILIASDMFPAMIETLKRLLPDDDVRVCRGGELEREIRWAEVLVPAMTRVTAAMVRSAANLKLIQQFGVGLEGVDVRAASARGVPVANVPGGEAPVHAECTAEGGVFLMMACARRYRACQEAMARGEWGRPRGEALIGRTALIIGLGAVGRALASRLVGLGMSVMASEPQAEPDLAERLGLARVAAPEHLLEMLPLVDFVISAVTLTERTRGLLGLPLFRRMKPTAFVINISRGPIVNEVDLLQALDQGLIAGAGLDVLTEEPPKPDHPLLRHGKVTVTPHTAGVTEQSFDALGQAVARNVMRLKRGEAILHTADPSQLD